MIITSHQLEIVKIIKIRSSIHSACHKPSHVPHLGDAGDLAIMIIEGADQLIIVYLNINQLNNHNLALGSPADQELIPMGNQESGDWGISVFELIHKFFGFHIKYIYDSSVKPTNKYILRGICGGEGETRRHCIRYLVLRVFSHKNIHLLFLLLDICEYLVQTVLIPRELKLKKNN